MRATEDMNGYDALKREQAFNRMFRRCQIVNVKQKARPLNLWPVPLGPAFMPNGLGFHTAHEACRGCIGKICGNVACPSRPVVTCGAQPLGKEFEAAIYSDVESLYELSTPSLSNGGA